MESRSHYFNKGSNSMIQVGIFVVSTLLTVGSGVIGDNPPITVVQKTPGDKGPPPRPPIFREKNPPLPVAAQWDLKALKEKYLILNQIYDSKKNQITWNLQARENVPFAAYYAGFLDGDQLEI